MEEKLTEFEKGLVKVLRTIPFGEVHIMMQNGQPVRILQRDKSILVLPIKEL